MKPDPPVRCTFKKWRPHTPVLFVELECVQNLASKDIIHYRTFTLMTTITMVPDGWKREGGGLFKGEEGDHCEIKHVRDRWCVFKWNMWNKTWRGFSWWRPTKTVSLVKIVIFLPLHSQPCSLFKYWIAIFLLERHFWPDFFWILTCERPVVAKSWI